MITVETIAEVRARCDAARAAGQRVRLVPTMGAFHDGHLSLMRNGGPDELVVVSLFVNPTQFAPDEDLAAYPRDLAGDAAKAEQAGVHVLFTPSVEEMYPEPPLTRVDVSDLTAGLCGASRPEHFGGVATVCTKLFSIVGPCTAHFGKKDYQQLLVIRRVVADLNLPVVVVGGPIVREPDGLAMSSRNAYLSPDQRRAATVLHRALEHALAVVTGDMERDAGKIRAAAGDVVRAEPLAELDYLEVVRAGDLRPLERVEDQVPVLVALAVRFGSTRLIDNTTCTVDGPRIRFDLQRAFRES